MRPEVVASFRRGRIESAANAHFPPRCSGRIAPIFGWTFAPQKALVYLLQLSLGEVSFSRFHEETPVKESSAQVGSLDSGRVFARHGRNDQSGTKRLLSLGRSTCQRQQ
jgi:hypothetical protein